MNRDNPIPVATPNPSTGSVGVPSWRVGRTSAALRQGEVHDPPLSFNSAREIPV